jgi:Arc/MetJ-type ribon-helix-helix transcriptional regulator
MKNTTINISLPKALLDAADKQAETELRNRSELIREAVRDYLLKRGQDNPADTFTPTEYKRIDQFASELDTERKWVVLSLVYRSQPNRIKEIFGGENSPVTKLVEHPGGFRSMGWDLETLDRARPTAGEYLQVKNGIRKILRVYRDGQVLFAGDEEFIGWAVNKDQECKVFSVNALATSELITNFVRFGRDLSTSLDENPSKMILKAGFHNPHKETVRLALVHRNIPFPEASSPEAVNGFTPEVSIPLTKDFSLEKEGYKFLAEFFFLFNLREDEFWYVDKETKEVNLEFFKDR